MEGENHEKREENVSSESNNNHNTESKPNVAHSGVPAFASEDVPSVEGEDVGKSKSVISMGTAPTHVPTTKAKDEQQLTKSMRENPWMLSTMVLGAIVLVLLFLGNFSGGITGNVVAAGVVSADTVGDNLVEYLNTVAEEDVTLIDVEDDGFMYLVTVEYRGEELPIYVTKDGERYTPSLLPITDGAVSTPSNTATPTTPEVVKSDNPLTELFIMTHCPYGTQAEKGIIPTIKTLGDDANVKIRFVHYFMHDPETPETPRQVCIREEQEDKFIPYLECFLEDGDSVRCIIEAEVDEAAMDECISNGNAEKYYAEDSALSQEYGVSGSPTLVVNGVIASSGRDSQSYLNAVCGSFNTPPEVCVTAEVSSASPAPGFGWDETGSATTASC